MEGNYNSYEVQFDEWSGYASWDSVRDSLFDLKEAMEQSHRLADWLTLIGVPTKQFITLYKTHVCAATDYTSHVWINSKRASKASRILDKIQNIAMRKALGALHTTP